MFGGTNIFPCQFQMRGQIMFAATNPIYRPTSASDLVGAPL